MKYFLYKEHLSKFNQLFRCVKAIVFTLFLIAFTPMAAAGYSQNKRVTIQGQQLTTKEVMKIIEDQTDYLFVYNRNEVNLNRSISINIKKRPVTEVLNQLFANSDIGYRIIGKNISLTKRTEATASITNQQVGKRITGSVIDVKGEPIIGANIVVKGAMKGVITDIEGHFSLELSTGSIIIVSYMGYLPQEIQIGTQRRITIKLREDLHALEEVVVVGYGTVKKENLTGSVVSIKSDVFKDRPSASPATSLQGVAAGLTVMQKSNYPGSGASVQLREVSSWQGGSAPLYVIDGIQRTAQDFALLNPTDIDNISVLKDAASSAIYGMKAGNGVILVTTKQGKAGKPAISYSFSYSTKKPTMFPEYFNAYELSGVLNETYRQMGIEPSSEEFFTPDEREYFKTHSYENDWKKAVWQNNPTDQTHNLSVSGGVDAYRYYVSGSFLKQKGATNNMYNKYTFLAKMEGKIMTGLDFSLIINGSWDKKERPYWAYGNSDDLAGLIGRAMSTAQPWKPPFINDLPTANFDNTNMGALARGDGGSVKNEVSTFNPVFELKYKIPGVEGLKVRVKGAYSGYSGYDRTLAIAPRVYYFKTAGEHNHIITDEVDYSIIDAAQTTGTGSPERLRTYYRRKYSYQLDGFMEYQRTFGRHYFSALAGYEYLRSQGDFMGTVVDGFPNLNWTEVNGSLGVSDEKKRWVVGNRDNLWAQASYIGRLDYNYNQQYILGVTFRADGSYIFPPKSRWGYFPSLSAAWNVAKEAFFTPLKNYLEVVKMRASWGITGSNETAPWQWQQSYGYSSNSGLLFGGATAPKTSLGGTINPHITWEKNQNVGVGLDLAMPANKLFFITDYWYKRTTDILGTRQASVPNEVGAELPAINYGIVSAQGVEFTLGHENTIGEFHYKVSGNISFSNNKIIEMDQASAIRDYENRIGKPVSGGIFGYQSEGLIRTQADVDRILAEHGADFTIFGSKPQPGMLMYKDFRGPAGMETPDGKIDKYDRNFISWNSKPRITYGLVLGADWKRFDFSAVFAGFARYEGVAQNYWFNTYGWGGNPAWWRDMWTPENAETAKYPSAVFLRYMKGQNYDEISTFWLKDRSFVRLKNVTFGYNVNVSKLSPVKHLRLFFSGENLFEITSSDWMKFSDPEIGGFGRAYPVLRSFTAGASITF